MTAVGGYVLSVISASVIVAILSSFFDGKGATGGFIKLISGLFLTFVIINPVTKLDFSRVNHYLDEFTLEGMEAAAVGENLARDKEAEIIISHVQAYILDKAEFLGAQLDVEVILGQNNIPASVKLKGNISPYAKVELTEIITENLGISKEHQLWIG